MKVLSLFSGIGAFEKALDVLKIPYELVGYCEIDKYASKSYSAIHDVPETMNLGDITKIDEKALPKDIDLITYGFPCQDISLAGKQKGLFNEDGSQTRSGLFFEALRIIEEAQPKVAIAENVKNLVGKKFNAQFQIVLASLETAGYNNYWQVLNAKNYGIPQNRERVFIVSIRKDIDTGNFKFPEPFPLELRLKDMLEDVVDEKFYLSETAVARLLTTSFTQGKYENRVMSEDGVCNTLLARDYKDPKCIEVFDLYNKKQIDSDVVGTITTGCSRNGSGTFLVREATKKGYAEAVEGDSINLEQPNSKTRRGRVGHGVAQTLTTSPQQGVVVGEPKINVIGNYSPSGHDASRIVSPEGLAPTVKENHGTVTATVQDRRFRKFTPKECFRLMGFTDEDFAKAEVVNSNTQLYKQAGNSIVVNVLAHIFTNLKSEVDI